MFLHKFLLFNDEYQYPIIDVFVVVVDEVMVIDEYYSRLFTTLKKKEDDGTPKKGSAEK